MKLLALLERLMVAKDVCSCTFGLRRPWYSPFCTSSCI